MLRDSRCCQRLARFPISPYNSLLQYHPAWLGSYRHSFLLIIIPSVNQFNLAEKIPQLLTFYRGIKVLQDNFNIYRIKDFISYAFYQLLPPRSEERRVGKECRSRWWRYH